MSKYTDFREKVDRQEAKVDGWLMGLRDNPNTARTLFVIAFVVLIVVGVLWIA